MPSGRRVSRRRGLDCSAAAASCLRVAEERFHRDRPSLLRLPRTGESAGDRWVGWKFHSLTHPDLRANCSCPDFIPATIS